MLGPLTPYTVLWHAGGGVSLVWRPPKAHWWHGGPDLGPRNREGNRIVEKNCNLDLDSVREVLQYLYWLLPPPLPCTCACSVLLMIGSQATKMSIVKHTDIHCNIITFLLYIITFILLWVFSQQHRYRRTYLPKIIQADSRMYCSLKWRLLWKYECFFIGYQVLSSHLRIVILTFIQICGSCFVSQK